jgi:predicted nicotinamide N-methyase
MIGEAIFPPKGHDIIEIGGFRFVSMPDRSRYVASVISGRYDDAPCAADKTVKTVLDLGAGQGEFAYWAMKRWPECWVTCVESDPRRLATLRHNARCGVKVLDSYRGVGSIFEFDVVRVTDVRYLLLLEQVQTWREAREWSGFLIVDIISRGTP